jgi:predicted RNA-binding protein with PIN domain
VAAKGRDDGSEVGRRGARDGVAATTRDVAGAAGEGDDTGSPSTADAGGSSASRLYVDAMNVIGSRPDGWWRDRDGALRRLVGRLRRYAADRPGQVVVVADGRPVADLHADVLDGVEVVYARRGGADAADDRIVELLDAEPDPHEVAVVTADRGLRERVRRRGIEVLGPKTLLAQLPSSPHTDA